MERQSLCLLLSIFRDRAMERRYQTYRLQQCQLTDFPVMFKSFLSGIVMMVVILVRFPPTVPRVSSIVGSILINGFSVFFFYIRRHYGLPWRDSYVIVVRLLLGAICAYSLVPHWDPYPSIQNRRVFWVKVILDTSVISEWYQPFCYTLPFQKHIIVQTMTLLLVLKRARPMFCARLLLNPGQSDGSVQLPPMWTILVDNMANGTTGVCQRIAQQSWWRDLHTLVGIANSVSGLTRMALGPSLTGEGTLAVSCEGLCLGSVALFQLLAGWLLPSVALALVEWRSRHEWLLNVVRLRQYSERVQQEEERRRRQSLKWWFEMAVDYSALLVIILILLEVWKIILWWM